MFWKRGIDYWREHPRKGIMEKLIDLSINLMAISFALFLSSVCLGAVVLIGYIIYNLFTGRIPLQ